MAVDSFKFLPRLLATFYQMTEKEPELPIPWTPLPKRPEECTFGLVTSGGYYCPATDPPFDLEREKEEPTWGDPTFRRIRLKERCEPLEISHLHYNAQSALQDPNILLPMDRFLELREGGEIQDVANFAYSFMGYQGYPPDTRQWSDRYGPEVAAEMKAMGVEGVLLTPA